MFKFRYWLKKKKFMVEKGLKKFIIFVIIEGREVF